MSINKINLMAIIFLFAIVFLTTVSAEPSPALQCFMVMQTYCNEYAPTALDCARAAVVNWSVPLPIDYMQEYFESLYFHLNTSNVLTPIDFCRKIAFYSREDCKKDLMPFRTADRNNKNGQRSYAVNIAFFNSVLTCECEEINEDGNIGRTRITTDHERIEHSIEQKYMISIHKEINIRTETMYTPEEFCRTKYEPGFRIPAVKECFIAMETYCRVGDPTPLDCTKAAFQFWRREIPQTDMQEYYETLFAKLNTSTVPTPEDFCSRHRYNYDKRQCRNDLKNYFIEHQDTEPDDLKNYFIEHQDTEPGQQFYAVYYAFFNAVLSTEDQGNLTFEDKYILRIQQTVILDEDSMDSPDVFCRIKHVPNYTRPVP